MWGCIILSSNQSEKINNGLSLYITKVTMKLVTTREGRIQSMSIEPSSLGRTRREYLEVASDGEENELGK